MDILIRLTVKPPSVIKLCHWKISWKQPAFNKNIQKFLKIPCNDIFVKRTFGPSDFDASFLVNVL